MDSTILKTQKQKTVRTCLHVDNLHCQSCVSSVTDIVSYFALLKSHSDVENGIQVVSDVDVSLATQTLSFTHLAGFDVNGLIKQLDAAGFDVRLESKSTRSLLRRPDLSWRSFMPSFLRPQASSSSRLASHKEICAACRALDSDSEITQAVSKTQKVALKESRFALEGMTCSSCTSAVSNILSPSSEPGIRSCQVTLLPPSALVVHDTSLLSIRNIKEMVESAGYGAELVTSKDLCSATSPDQHASHNDTTYKVVFSILGMTCSSCVSAVNGAMESIPGITSPSVDLIGNTGSVVVKSRTDAELVRNEIEDAGFECSIVDIIEQRMYEQCLTLRTVNLKIEGMACQDDVEKVNNVLGGLTKDRGLTYSPATLDHPVTTITYTPEPPSFTLRSIRENVASLGFALSVVRVDSIEERAARAHRRELRNILLRFIITFIFAVPTFVVAVVGMSILTPRHPLYKALNRPMWGNATRGTIILWILATPVQFGVGWFFYKRSLKSLKGVWRKRKAEANWRKVWLERLFRWGSMDTLVALGTSTGYFASLALMILDIRTTPKEGTFGEMGWFDSSVFLMLFILGGRYLESATKQRTGDAIATLSATKPTIGLLYSAAESSTTSEGVDFLEVGDILLVPAGSSPPLDAVLTLSSPVTTFDESSLTGEARPVMKSPGDQVFAGTTNAGPAAAIVTVTNEAGKTMLDGIVGVVRDAMGKKAGIERIADVVTGYFVPFVVGVAGLTFGVWCLRGYIGNLPIDWIDSQRRGGWVLFAIQFGVAVLVVACPCGIGLAAPTAQMVGIGLAAQNGILSNGGGEAFQTISSLNTVVLDKTGTLTTSKFTVSDHQLSVHGASRNLVLTILRAAENASTHPLAVGVREWCQTQLGDEKQRSVELVSSEEIPGRGLIASLVVDDTKIEVAIGNEKLMQDVEAKYQSPSAETQAGSDLLAWQMAGKSVILMSIRLVSDNVSTLSLPISSQCHSILGLFGVHDPPRAEAVTLIAELRRLGMDVWMISGDNAVTAKTVAQSVGIDSSRVVAGALPKDKQEWVKRLQSGEGYENTRVKSWWGSESTPRRIVAFCGDGINDAPAIAQADVGLAMGGGSNVAVSTADFCLLNSNLLSIITIHHLAKATRRKIISNFIWACLYNLALMPLAAGAFYALGRTSLPPVWGSAAMALSSVSVVINSLFLRWLYRVPKVVRTWNTRNCV